MTFRIHASIAIVMALLVSTLSGCGAPADRVVKRQIDLMNQMAAAMENKAPQATLENIQKQMQENGERASDLDLTADEWEQIGEKYKSQIEAASKRLIAAMTGDAFNNMPGWRGFDGFPGFSGARNAPNVPAFGR